MTKKFEVCPRCGHSEAREQQIKKFYDYMEATSKRLDAKRREWSKGKPIGDCSDCRENNFACDMTCVL